MTFATRGGFTGEYATMQADVQSFARLRDCKPNANEATVVAYTFPPWISRGRMKASGRSGGRSVLTIRPFTITLPRATVRTGKRYHVPT